jgi:Tfp pilus assembly protein FimT
MARLKAYTLIELTAVLAVIVLTLSIIIAGSGKIPVFISLEKTANEIRSLFADAAIRAALQGKPVSVVYDDESRTFTIEDGAGGDGDNGGGAERDRGALPAITDSSKQKTSAALPDSADVEFDPKPEGSEKPRLKFYPDGGASGPRTIITMKGHEVSLRISKLTGNVFLEKTD